MQQQAPPNLGSNYQFLEYLGRGSNGIVVKALDLPSSDVTHQEEVAIKLVPRSNLKSIQPKYLSREVTNHSRLAEHPHIICFREVFLTQEHVCLVMEYANYGTLLQFVKDRKRLEEHLARRFFQQLILAVDYCHQMDIASRDIKCENILLAQPLDNLYQSSDLTLLVKLCDFGFSKSANNHVSLMQSSVGTPAYMAPEVIASRGSRAYDGKAADIWSCGVTLFVTLYGALPFAYSNEKMTAQYAVELPRLYSRMLRQELYAPTNVPVTDDCHRLLIRLLDPDPRRRITAQQLFSVPWFKEDLPPGTEEFNAGVIRAAVGPAQSEEEINAVLESALSQ